ncbi:cytochrome C oxidase subunit IV family protein [Celeribacter neptunius]|uniref:Cytochrome C oxidase subunit IV n=1 Tax=Celeribacter neptunius TaxID=588602 RepID=A0A1I3R523_9RHOB|nr:cytochrome C oxidase subunit IV family protein [Celeribacter neptunius]SFJ41713.1 Cytochrome C oxidase subunit IV [Celeribacter neptunius]
MKELITAWLILVGASAATTALAVIGPETIWLAPVLLGLAFVKSRVILAAYLELRQAPRILSGVTLAVALWFVIAITLGVIG